MKGDKLYRDIGDADEKYIKSAEKAFEKGEQREKIKNTGRLIKRIISIAAAIAIIGGLWVVSFIVAQNRQEPNATANTGESADTEDGSVSDVTQAVEPVEVDPESECGKMMQAFDGYLKTKETGKYGDYYVSYCVKVNGAYIGFINDEDMQFTDAEESEVIYGLPFLYGDGQKLTVIKNGEYRSDLDQAYKDGLLGNDDVFTLFDIYSADNIRSYNSRKSALIRYSFTEFLGGYNEKDAITTAGAESNMTLYNYIHVAYCKKLADNKFASLYLTKDEELAEFDEMTVNIGGYDFVFKKGLELRILDGYDNIYSLEQAQLPENELKLLYESYSEFMKEVDKLSEENSVTSPIPPDTDEELKISTEYKDMRYAIDLYYNNGRNGSEYYGYNVYYAKVTGDTYFAFIDDGKRAYTDDITMTGTAGYMFTYYSGQRFTVLKDGQIVYGIDEAYKNGLVSEEEIGELFRDYHDNTQAGSDDFSKNYALKTSFEEYLGGASERDATNRPQSAKDVTFYNQVKILFCMKLEGGGYAAIFDKYGDTMDKTAYYTTETAQGYEFFYNFGNVIRVLDGNGLTSLPDSDLSKEEVYSVLRAYISFYNTFYDRATSTTALFESFIQTGTSWENNVYYAYKTSDGAYIGIMANGDLEDWEETVAGYTFDHPNGNKFLVIKNNTLTEGLTEAYESGVISDSTVYEFYINYNKSEEDQDNSGYETTVYMIRANRDGHGVSTKTVSTCDLAYSIIDALGDLRKTGEIADKTSDIPDDPVDSHSEYIFPEAERGMLWLQVGSKLYRVSSDLSEIAIVDSYFGKGYVLTMTDGLKTLLNNAWYYFPYDTYSATYDNAENKTVVNHVYTAESTVKIDVKQINIEKSVEPNNSITLDLTSSFDQYVTVSLTCYQSDDNLAAGDYRGIQLNANETKQITLNFGGWKDFTYWVDITADNTRVSLTIKP